MECRTLHQECTWSVVGVYFFWWVIWPSPWSGILVYTYTIRSVVGVYTPVGVVTEWLWSVHSKLECTLRQGKGNDNLWEVCCGTMKVSHFDTDKARGEDCCMDTNNNLWAVCCGNRKVVHFDT